MQEPVNIMGVVAFPDPSGKRDIRFIDPNYNILFTVPDGANILMTDIDGSTDVRKCRYIDDTHAKIGDLVYHICEFAECMAEAGCVYAPEGGSADTYEIYQIPHNSDADYLFLSYEHCADYVSAADYRRVYAGMLTPDTSLDDIYVRHNRDDRPFRREMRSVSVSDVIVLTRAGERKVYYVDSIGFVELTDFKT